MRFAFRTAGYRDFPLADALVSISSLGYDGVELCLEHRDCRPEELGAVRAQEIARACQDVGLAVASISYHADFEPDALRTRNQRRAVLLTRDFGTDILILNAQKAIAGQEREQWDAFRRTLDVLLPLAAAEGVFICLEPEPGHFLNSCADMRRLLDEVAHPSLAVNLDVGHAFLTDDDLPAAIADLGPAIRHVHIEGMPAGVHKHLIPGEGDLDLALVHAALQTAAYQGFYTVDLFDIAQAPEDFAARSLTALQALFP